MRDSLSESRELGRNRFQRVVETFLSQPGLPFAQVLSAERVECVFQRHGNLFGLGAIYSTAIMTWSFLSQALRDGKEASCQAAVARIIVHQQQCGGPVPSSDTGDYCKARAKLSEAALHGLAIEVAEEMQRQAPEAWRWKGRHAKLVDGFTFTMPDTPANQAEYPQATTQKPGVGFPIARCCAILSLATACIMDLALGPYAGKETGETALLRQLLDHLEAGDVLVADRFYCSFWMLALLLGRGVDGCVRLHQRRHSDFRRGKRLGKDDHLIVWTKPKQRPEWMDEATYAALERDAHAPRDSLSSRRAGTPHPGVDGHHHAARRSSLHQGRHRRVVRLSLELGTRYSFDQSGAQPRARALQVAGHGAA